MQEKVLNDAAAYIRSLAGSHGRNMDWAEKAVRESVSATEGEALELNVIDMVATNLDALVSQLDGRQVTMLDGKQVTLQTKGATLNYVDMTAGESLLHVISEPNIYKTYELMIPSELINSNTSILEFMTKENMTAPIMERKGKNGLWSP
jgi:membrane-bound serine protease (ClpP class)